MGKRSVQKELSCKYQLKMFEMRPKIHELLIYVKLTIYPFLRVTNTKLVKWKGAGCRTIDIVFTISLGKTESVGGGGDVVYNNRQC